MLALADVRGKVDFGIVTIRPDEYTCVLRHLRDRRLVRGTRFYEYAEVATTTGGRCGVAVTRCLEQGNGDSFAVASDLIDDVDPSWILVVGIAGGFPHEDFSLGDVLLASRIYDFTVSAAIQDGDKHIREWNPTGTPVHHEVERLLAAIPGWANTLLKGWSGEEKLGMARPACDHPADITSPQLYGPQELRGAILNSLPRHFPREGKPRQPVYAVASGASGNTLVKDAEIAAEWKRCARSTQFVEMEASGVCRAARRGGRDIPVLVVRGLSDIIGLKRTSAWTEFACHSAATFAATLITSGVCNTTRVPQASGAPGAAPAREAAAPGTTAAVQTGNRLPDRTVDTSGSADHTSIAEAIRAAQSGERIVVRPGIYPDPLVITKQLTIVGEGEPGAVVIQTNDKDQTAVLFKAHKGHLSNLTIRQLGRDGGAGVDIAQGVLTMESCVITSKGRPCVVIRDGAEPVLRGNRIHASSQAGVHVYDNGLGLLEKNEITSHGRNGVEIGTGAAPTLRQNRIFACEHAGVYCYDGGAGLLEGNDIFENKTNGIVTRGGSNPTVRRNRIERCDHSGVYAFENGRGVFEDNEIVANRYNNVAVASEAHPLFRRNTISSAMRSGAHIHAKGRGVFEENTIKDNMRNGVEVGDESSVTLRDNLITNSGHAGIYIHHHAHAEVERNTVSDNAESGVAVVDGAHASVLANTLANNGHQGIHIRDGKGIFEDNVLSGNRKGALYVYPESDLNVRLARNREM